MEKVYFVNSDKHKAVLLLKQGAAVMHKHEKKINAKLELLAQIQDMKKNLNKYTKKDILAKIEDLEEAVHGSPRRRKTHPAYSQVLKLEEKYEKAKEAGAYNPAQLKKIKEKIKELKKKL